MSTSRKKVDPTEYPALRGFLLGYLHEDYIVDYGSAEKALEAYRDDTNENDRHELSRDAARFLAATEGLSLKKLRDLLEDGFGSAWAPEDRDEVTRVLGSIA